MQKRTDHDSRTCKHCAPLRHPSQRAARITLSRQAAGAVPGRENGGAA
ncbi:hypothetical protein ACH4Q7_22355 [Streptomyces roseolus]